MVAKFDYFLRALISAWFWSIVWIFFMFLFLWKRPRKSLLRMQRKSFLQLAIRASWSEHLLAQTSLFSTNPKIFWWTELVSQFFCKLNSSKYFTCPSGKLRTEFTSPIAKSTSCELSDTTFFAHCFLDHTSNRFRRSPNLIFLKGFSPWFWSKIWNFFLVCIWAKHA